VYSEEQFFPLSERLRTSINTIGAFWGEASCCKDNMLTIKVLFGLHIGIFFASFFSLASLVYMALMALFVVPKALGPALLSSDSPLHSQVQSLRGILDGVIAKIPKASDCEEYKESKKVR